MVTTTSASWMISIVHLCGTAVDMSMPISRIASAATGFTVAAGSEPPEKTWTRSPPRTRANPAAIWERPALWTQRKTTVGVVVDTGEPYPHHRTKSGARTTAGSEERGQDHGGREYGGRHRQRLSPPPHEERGQDHGREHVGHPHLFQIEQAQRDPQEQDAAGGSEPVEHGVGEHPVERAGGEGDAALDHGDGHRRGGYPPPVHGGKGDRGETIECRLHEQQLGVPETILDRADDGERSDAEDEGGDDETLGEPVLMGHRQSGLGDVDVDRHRGGETPLQSLAQPVQPGLDPYQFAEHRPEQHGPEHQGKLVGGQDLPKANRRGRQAEGGEHRAAHAFRELPAGNGTDHGAGQHGGDVGDRADGNHHGSPRKAAAAPKRTRESSPAAARGTRSRLGPTPMAAMARTARHRIHESSSKSASSNSGRKGASSRSAAASIAARRTMREWSRYPVTSAARVTAGSPDNASVTTAARRRRASVASRAATRISRWSSRSGSMRCRSSGRAGARAR